MKDSKEQKAEAFCPFFFASLACDIYYAVQRLRVDLLCGIMNTWKEGGDPHEDSKPDGLPRRMRAEDPSV